MNIDIYIVSFAKDFRYLIYNLRSIAKFAQGFNRVLVAIPEWDEPALRPLLEDYDLRGGTIPITPVLADEWKEKPHIHHDYLVMMADTYSDADLILHTDSDCIFTEPFTPEDYLVDGKPILLALDIDVSIARVPGTKAWKEATLASIGFCPFETMQRHPAVHWRKTYVRARERIQEHTGKPIEAYLRGLPDDNRGGFCEFVALGNVAIRDYRDDYHLVFLDTHPRPKDKLRQAWSIAPPTVTDMQVYRSLGLL